MNKDFTVECWLYNQRISARIVTHDHQVYQEYYPTISSGFNQVDLHDYYFISNYDGSLELNQAPKDEVSAILLKELADSLQSAISHSPEQVFLPATYLPNRLPGGTPSAAA